MDSDGDSQRLLSDDKMEDLENEALMALNNHESINGGGRRSIDWHRNRFRWGRRHPRPPPGRKHKRKADILLSIKLERWPFLLYKLIKLWIYKSIVKLVQKLAALLIVNILRDYNECFFCYRVYYKLGQILSVADHNCNHAERNPRIKGSRVNGSNPKIKKAFGNACLILLALIMNAAGSC